MNAYPTLHLPHLLRVLGPSSLTLYKQVLGRQRMLMYTQPPVEAACFLCQVAADMCFEDQTTPVSDPTTECERPGTSPQLKGKHKEGINVFGIIALHDIDMLERESRIACGWIACTTDAVFLAKPQHYDLIIDLTSYAPPRGRACNSPSRSRTRAGPLTASQPCASPGATKTGTCPRPSNVASSSLNPGKRSGPNS